MLIEPAVIRLRDGRDCLLRSPEPDDAEAMLRHARRIAAETEFVSAYSDEIHVSLEDEIQLIRQFTASAYQLCVLAFVADDLAGVCMIQAKSGRRKSRHRTDLGISVQKAFWSLGIGRALLRTALEEAAKLEIEQIELCVYEGNDRARQLYQDAGFVEIGLLPKAAKLKDGSYRGEYIMVYEITRTFSPQASS